MKKIRSSGFVLIGFLIIADVFFSRPAFADVTHCGTISSNETWSSSGNVHQITCDVIVASGVTLTIEDGVIVKFDTNTSLTVNGALRVLGTGADPVYFTSYRDDTVGGDTNGDGGSTGAQSDWDFILFTDTSDDVTSLIDHAVIRYGGYWGAGGAVHLSEASPTIQNTTLEDNDWCALTADLRSFPTLTGNTYQDNNKNAFCLFGGTVDLNATWDVTDVSYYLLDDVTVGVGSTLTVDPGVIVKVAVNKQLTVNGALRIEGTGADPVYFTSYRDDTVGGDTNGDGGSAGAEGDWGAIDFADTGGDNSHIEYASIRFGNGVNNNNRTLTITGSTFIMNTFTLGGAINNNQGTLIVNSSTFTNNSAQYGGGINNYLGDLTVSDSTFSGNSASYSGAIGNNLGIVTISNSTFYNNTASNSGGGVNNHDGVMTISNSTLSGNSAPTGGGILNGVDGTLHLKNTISADSSLGGDCVNNGTLATNTNNLIEDGSCSPSVSGDPILSPLADNGGLTETMALLLGSPAIDVGDNATCESTDQRGWSRPIDGDLDGSAVCDIGAYEKLIDLFLPLIMR